MSGVRGLLDDAQDTAIKLERELWDIAAAADDDDGVSPQAAKDCLDLWHLADDLQCKIEMQRNALRRG